MGLIAMCEVEPDGDTFLSETLSKLGRVGLARCGSHSHGRFVDLTSSHLALGSPYNASLYCFIVTTPCMRTAAWPR
jgi:hypothetical protein